MPALNSLLLCSSNRFSKCHVLIANLLSPPDLSACHDLNSALLVSIASSLQNSNTLSVRITAVLNNSRVRQRLCCTLDEPVDLRPGSCAFHPSPGLTSAKGCWFRTLERHRRGRHTAATSEGLFESDLCTVAVSDLWGKSAPSRYRTAPDITCRGSMRWRAI